MPRSTHTFGPLWPASHGHLGSSRVGYKVIGSLAMIQTNVDADMSASKYTLPCPVYLPSSGGYTSSRLSSEVSSFTISSCILTHDFSMQPFHRRVFAFRKYSVEEDGRLVARTRNGGHELCASSISYREDETNAVILSRNKPYERPSRPATFQSKNRDVPQASQDSLPRKQVEGAALSRLFQQLVPLTTDPSNFESKAAAICEAFDLDPTTSTEIISSFKHRLPADTSQRSKYVRRSYFRVLPLKSSPSPPATSGPTISEPRPTASLTPIPVPVKHQRPFTSGPKGCTVWYTTALSTPLSSPPASLPATAGVLYIHTNLSTDTKQVWLCNISCNWTDITSAENVKHPSIADRFFLLRSDGIPSWLSGANYAVIQSRREKSGR
jgi:hypothetical protein